MFASSIVRPLALRWSRAHGVDRVVEHDRVDEQAERAVVSSEGNASLTAIGSKFTKRWTAEASSLRAGAADRRARRRRAVIRGATLHQGGAVSELTYRPPCARLLDQLVSRCSECLGQLAREARLRGGERREPFDRTGARSEEHT